jgi:hypothetical protein
MQHVHARWVLAAVVASWSAVAAQKALQVSIDVKPGDTPTTIETERGGMLPVAILTTAQFDASTVDPSTIRIGPTGTEAEIFRSMREDVNRDGRTDLLVLVRLQEMRVKCGDTAIRLTGKTTGGADIEGSEKVAVEGCTTATDPSPSR